MNRISLLLVVVMSLFIGRPLPGQATPNKDPWGPPPPPRTAPPTPPKAPIPPKPPRAVGGGGISISIQNNKVKIQGLDQMVAGHLAAVRELLRNNPDIPKDVRDKIVQRMDRVKGIVDKHLANLSNTDLDKLDDQLEKMGDELEKAMEGLDADLAALGDKIGKKVAKDIAKNLGKDLAKGFAKKNFQFNFGPDVNDDSDDDDDDDDSDDSDPSDDDDNDSAGTDRDPPDVQITIDDLKNFSLKPAQKDAIDKLRVDADKKVAAAKKQLDEASTRLETALADVKTSDADIGRYIDRVSELEATIRKARILTWVNTRRLLDPDQVKRLEAAVAKTR